MKNKKDDQVRIKITKELKAEFKIVCIRNKTTMSKTLTSFIDNYVENYINSKGKIN